MVIRLILQRLTVIYLLFLTQENIWNAYILFLIFLGGLLIIFIYLSALLPNEIFRTNKNSIIVFVSVRGLSAFFSAKFYLNYGSRVVEAPLLYGSFFFQSLLPIIIRYLICVLFSVISISRKSKTPAKINSYDPTKILTYP
jgi:hypothetical protein